jgi:transcriptional regulator with XRE-family HTH domain
MDTLGKTIREIRKSKNLTLKDVARMTDLTESLISQIENSKANPSVSSLVAISRVLGVPVGTFFENKALASHPVIRTTDRPVVHTANGITYQLMSRDVGEHPVEVLWAAYDPGATTGSPMVHEGVECGVVLKGKLEVAIGNQKFVLNGGDSITFDSSEPHALTNLSDRPTSAIWINSPPSF